MRFLSAVFLGLVIIVSTEILPFSFSGCTAGVESPAAVPAPFVAMVGESTADIQVYHRVQRIPLATPDSLFVGEIVSVSGWPDGFGVLDRANATPLVFDSGGTFQFRLGQRGTGPGEFMRASAMAFHPQEDRWFVADSKTLRISWFSRIGEFLGDCACPSTATELALVEDTLMCVFLPKARTGGLVRLLDYSGRSVVEFFPPSQFVATFPFNVAGGGMLCRNGRIFASHYLSDSFGVYTTRGSHIDTREMRAWGSYVPIQTQVPGDPQEVLRSFTGVTKLLPGPYGSILVQYSFWGSTDDGTRRYCAFVDSNGVIVGHPLRAEEAYMGVDWRGRILSVEYPPPGNVKSNPTLVVWTSRPI